jgi:cell division protein FtsI/penicillin-binding protein 2
MVASIFSRLPFFFFFFFFFFVDFIFNLFFMTVVIYAFDVIINVTK